MAWLKTIPTNDELLINFPALCRANWDALELGTDANLKITNAKCAAAMGLVDTKLAQITTASKVSGTALTLLPNIIAGAGVLPDANSPNKLKADAGDTTPQYLDSLIDTDMFEISGGDLLNLKDGGVEAEKLESGSAAPGNWKFYGTEGAGAFGFRSPDHGNLAGLADDDHSQYHNTARHDADDHSGLTGFAHRQLFTSNGTFTVPAGITRVYVSLCGGGGGGYGSTTGGGNSGCGGGGAETIEKSIHTVTPLAEISITVGAGGNGGAIGGHNGENGEVSVWDTGGIALTVTAGGGGQEIVVGIGASANSMDAPDPGTSGQSGAIYSVGGGDGGSDNNRAEGGGGGGAKYGRGATGSVSTGTTGASPGVGGSAGGQTNRAGGSGADGFVLVEW